MRASRRLKHVPILWLVLFLAACSSPRVRIEREMSGPITAKSSASSNDSAPRRGGYYQDDGPGENAPSNLEQTPDAEPRIEPLAKGPNRPYEVFGKRYVPDLREIPFQQRGVASWYGRKFHGQRTSSGEIYDMYAMTAAHPTLPIPSYVRITNPANGKTVVVRVNDRGPFHSDRIMDLSYTAALKLGYVNQGSALVEVERILPIEIVRKKPDALLAERLTAPLASVVENVATSEPAHLSTKGSVKEILPSAIPDEAPLAGVFIQLGAFSARDKAENLRAEIYQQFAWLSEPIQIETRDNLHRLLAGPYATREAASGVAQRMSAALPAKALIVTR